MCKFCTKKFIHLMILVVVDLTVLEILSMLEEAVGTRMYETKKEATLKTLEKKQIKVEEINKLLDKEILHVVEKLKKERFEFDSSSSQPDKDIAELRYSVAAKKAQYKESKHITKKLDKKNQELKMSIKELHEA
ncbi:hypothetical protein TanjilG_16450 [Lupinus angustifolius]|uniref:Uncharacterized protein n=1 Tax=Lupinus angustifolius TaxID=3871 RepID=A0A1J7IE42_LUPAN|nr:hypothetical protein TanjilG_16450 [Lupinus angustifolius]